MRRHHERGRDEVREADPAGYARDGSRVRLVEFVDEPGRATRYAYHDGRGVVTCREADSSITEHGVPPGRMLARTRHPETGAWVHVGLAGSLAGGSDGSARPTQSPGTTAEGATAVRRVGGTPAPPSDRPAGSRLITITYDAAKLAAARSFAQVATYTCDRDDQLTRVQSADRQGVTYTYDRDGHQPDPGDEA